MFEAAPLVDTPDDPIPPGAEADWFVGAGGAKLRAALFTPPGRPRGSVVLSGGRTEPIEKYFETIADFMERGFVVLAHDWRGQGLSTRELPDRLKGHAKGYKSFLEDYRRLLNAYETRLPKPWVAVGHSMGGCLTLLALASGEKRFSSAVLSAPMLGLQFGKFSTVSAAALMRLNLMLGRSSRYVLGQPGKPFDEAFDENVLTHDPRRFARYRAQVRANPDLALGSPTWSWLDFAFRATALLANPERLRVVTIPVEIVSAAEDRLVDNSAQAAAARNLPQGRLITVPGAYHEILMETDDMRNIFLRVFDALTGKTAPKPADAPQPIPPAAPAAPAPQPEAAIAAVAITPPAARKSAAKPEAASAAKPVAKAKPAVKVAAPKIAKPPVVTAAKPTPKETVVKAVAKPVAAPTVVKAPVAKAPKPVAKPAAKVAAPKAAKASAVKAAKPATTKAAVKVVAKPAAKAVAPKVSKAPPPTVAKAATAKPTLKKAPAKKATTKKPGTKKPAAKK